MLIFLLFPAALHSQGGSGAVFLQLLRGAKQQATAGAASGALGDLYSIYINPAATGFLREWQWHATYAKWIAGVKNVSLLHGRKITTPWSDKTKLAFGVAYQGLQAFNSTEEPLFEAHANDLLLSASLGQPLSFESHQLSLGTNITFLQSTLGNFDAQSWMADFGLLLRTPRFRLSNSNHGLFEEGILSFGLALTHWGQALRFKNEKTPLPTTLRAGISFHSGVHDGLQLNVLADYRNVYGGEESFGIGTEVSIKESFALRTGYQIDSDLLSHLSFGASISLDRNKSILNDFAPQRNTALRLDFATTPSTEFFDNTFRSSVSYYPVDPESFRYVTPKFGAVLDTATVRLQWQQTVDPDLFDAVGYRLILDQDSLSLAQTLQFTLDNPNHVFGPADSLRLLVDMQTAATSYKFDPPDEGDYFWAVLAYDKDKHVRPASSKNGIISRFSLAAPDIEITSLGFEYSPIIRNDDYQGKLNLEMTNNSTRFAKSITLTIHKKLEQRDVFLSIHSTAVDSASMIHKQQIATLPAKGKKTLAIPWHTTTPGRYRITTHLAHRNKTPEIDTLNNTRALQAFTIPKGELQTVDTAYVRLAMAHLFDLPYISEIYFDKNSARLKPEYLGSGAFDPSLRRLARRLREHPGIAINIRGFADPNSGEMKHELAKQRAAGHPTG
ncbi:MAG: PorV/PorQ family protein, partial [bacterium]